MGISRFLSAKNVLIMICEIGRLSSVANAQLWSSTLNRFAISTQHYRKQDTPSGNTANTSTTSTRNTNIETILPQGSHVLVILSNATPGTCCVGCALAEGGTGGVAVEVDCDSNRFPVFDPYVSLSLSGSCQTTCT